MIELQEGGKAVISFSNDAKERKGLYDQIAKYVIEVIACCEPRTVDVVVLLMHVVPYWCATTFIHRGLKSKETHHTYLKAVQECQALLSTVLVRISFAPSCLSSVSEC